jgi:2'-5' RNA ligase
MTSNGEDPAYAGVARLFLAVDIGDQVRAALADCQQSLKEAPVRVGWVHPEHIHLTLVFLGDVFLAGLPNLRRFMDETAARMAPFAVVVAGLGAFGSPRSPRVVWAGIFEPPDPLLELQRELGAGLRRLGYRLEDRPFHPHLTLGRVRSARGAGELTSRIESATHKAFGRVAVDRILLVRSRLDSPGPRYETLYASPLKGAGTHGR